MRRRTCIHTAGFVRVLVAFYFPDSAHNTCSVRLLPRLPAGIRISLKMRGGLTHRIVLVRQPVGRRYWGRRDGKSSTKVPGATATQKRGTHPTLAGCENAISRSPRNPSFVGDLPMAQFYLLPPGHSTLAFGCLCRVRPWRFGNRWFARTIH